MPVHPKKAMLMNAMNIDPQFEDDFNRWYDTEHLPERVAMEGFIEARRWVAQQASRKYLATYDTHALQALTSAAYIKTLSHHTTWSLKNIARFQNLMRTVGEVTLSRVRGQGCALALMHVQPQIQDREVVRQSLHDVMMQIDNSEIIAMQLIESDIKHSPSPAPSAQRDAPSITTEDWHLLIEASQQSALQGFIKESIQALALPISSIDTYRMLWRLHKDNI